MKKKTLSRKLFLHRETITRLEKAAAAGLAGDVDVIGDVTSCTGECGCSPTGCSAEVACMGR